MYLNDIQVASRYKLALSGTPHRKDKGEVILQQFIGPITFQTRKKYGAQPLVRFVKTRCHCERKTPCEQQDDEGPHLDFIPLRIRGKTKANRVKMLTNVAKCPCMNRFIFEHVKSYVLSDKRRNVLLLGERLEVVDQLLALCEKDKDLRRAGVTASTFVGSGA